MSFYPSASIGTRTESNDDSNTAVKDNRSNTKLLTPNENTNKIPVWIKTGRIFRRVTTCNNHMLGNKSKEHQIMNCWSIL